MVLWIFTTALRNGTPQHKLQTYHTGMYNIIEIAYHRRVNEIPMWDHVKISMIFEKLNYLNLN